MKNHFFIGLLIFSITAVYGQERVFKITTWENSVKYDTLKSNENIDVFFFRKHFFIPYLIPSKLIDSNFKNEKLVRWNNEEGEKDFNRNWTYTSYYDYLSRIIKYEYSGCFACSQLPYVTSILYDDKNRPIEIVEQYKTIELEEIKAGEIPGGLTNFYKLEYNSNDEVKLLLSYEKGVFVKSIELMN